MKTLRFAALAAFAVAAILARGADATEAVKKDLARLQGEWTMVSGSADGQSMPEEMRKEMKRVCKGNETTTTLSGRVYLQAKISLDPAKKPKAIDYEMTEGPTKGKTQLGIYEVDGDTFKSCFSKPGDPRPQNFESKPGDGRTFSIWKRVNPEPSSPKKK